VSQSAIRLSCDAAGNIKRTGQPKICIAVSERVYVSERVCMPVSVCVCE